MVVQILSELFVFFILINFTAKSNVTCVPEDKDIQTDFKKVQRRNIFSESIKFLANAIKRFFGGKSKQMEDTSHFNNYQNLYIDEIIQKNPKPVTGPLNEYNPIRWEPEDQDINFTTNKSPDGKYDTNIEQLILRAGYQSESHTVLTVDGYMLTIQRILPATELLNKRIVILLHGLLGSAEDWLLLGPQRALPYLLIDNGYDVWLLNARGNKYSRIHTTLSFERQEFWDFSFHEIGIYDLPAAIKYISEVTKTMEINFVGHSLGATALLVLLSSHPEYNFVLRSGILLGPLVFMYHAKGPIRALADFYRLNGHNSLHFLGQTDFLADASFPDQITEKFCKAQEKTCSNPLLLLANGGRELVSDNLLEMILNHVPAGGSAKTIVHYIQLVRSGFFHNFDYGTVNNLRKYGNTTPPYYDLKKVTVPIAIFSSPSDWLATTADIHTLLPLLQDVNIHHVVKTDDFGHLDFAWSPDAPEFVYSFILTLLDSVLSKHDISN